jgi:hypothetical protein
MQARAQRPAAIDAIDILVKLPEMQQEKILEADDSQSRAFTVLRIANERLDQAKLVARVDPSTSIAEIENYKNLIEYLKMFINSITESSRERKQLTKMFELTLREQLVLLNECERLLGDEYAMEIGSIISFTRKARTEALNSLFGSPILASPPESN